MKIPLPDQEDDAPELPIPGKIQPKNPRPNPSSPPELPKPDVQTPVEESSKRKGFSLIPPGKKLNVKKLTVMFLILAALVASVVFVSKYSFTAFSVKDETPQETAEAAAPACTDDCSFEGKVCEDAKIYTCEVGADGCKHKNLIENCIQGSVCSAINKDKCYLPQTCDFEFHTCISTTSYKMCKNGKSIEGAEIKKCEEGLVCNKSPKDFGICVEK